MNTSEQANRRIVVGVDGSSTSKAALIWAAREAARTGALVEAVIAYRNGFTEALLGSAGF
jgi:nucleotide-binding universal stress UspA family protein